MSISLKNHSIREIEETVAAALSKLCEEPVEVKISSLVDTTHKWSFQWQIAIEAVITQKAPPDDGNFLTRHPVPVP